MTIKIGEIRVSLDLENEVTGEVTSVELRRGVAWPAGLPSQPPGIEPEPPVEEEADLTVRVPEPIDIDAEPATPDDRLPKFEVDDTLEHFKLVWDEGETAQGRRVLSAPFADGLWMIFVNTSEYLLMYKRDAAAQQFEVQGSIDEAKMTARGFSCRWIRVDQGNRVRQTIAQVHATDWVRWVGRTIDVDGADYHYRQGRLVRQIKTTVMRYRATEDERHPWIEVRITQGIDSEHVDVWLLQYDADQHLIGSLSDRNVARRDLVRYRTISFGLAPGKRLTWVSRGEELHADFRGKTLVIVPGTDTAALMERQRGERDLFLSCGPIDTLQRTAVSAALARRGRRRKPHTRPQKEATEPAPAPVAEPAPPIADAPSPAGSAEEEPRAPEPVPQDTIAEAVPPEERAEDKGAPVGKKGKDLLAALARAGSDRVSIAESASKRRLNRLLRHGFIRPDTYELTDKGREFLGVPADEKPGEAATGPAPDRGTGSEGEVSNEQASEIAKSFGDAVQDALKAHPPIT